VQALFNQGLLQAYNYNHPQALVDFEAALQEDPSAAMLYWGKVHALGE